jgi:D-aminoacyl-tRNA deacylase
MRLIVTSLIDIAGSNIYREISKNYGFTPYGEFEGSPVFKKRNILLIATEKGLVEAEHLDKSFSPEYYVFASRHRSVSGKRTLTVHTPGNLTHEAKVGGRPRELAFSAPDPSKIALLELERARVEKNLDYRVSMEVTHHGPTTLKKPVLFVEVGSTEKEWNDPSAVAAVSIAAMAAAENTKSYKKGVGIGGNHYAPRHTQFILKSHDTLGHLVPSYALESFDRSMFQEALTKSLAYFCFLDWKGMNRNQREKVLKLAKEVGIKIRKNISTGTEEIPEGYASYRVNKELFTLAERIDSEKLRAAILKNMGIAVEINGHITSEFFAPKDIKKEVLQVCGEILVSKNPFLSRNKLIFEEEKFDPNRAISLGLHPGPDFSKLKEGLEIQIDGRKIKYEDVIVINKRVVHLDDETIEILKELNVFKS